MDDDVAEQGLGSRATLRMRLGMFAHVLITLCVGSVFSMDTALSARLGLAAALFSLFYAASMTIFWGEPIMQEDFLRATLS